MTPFEVTALITLLANVMAEDLDNGQLDFAAAIFEQLGDTLATIAVQRENLSNNNSQKKKGDEEPI